MPSVSFCSDQIYSFESIIKKVNDELDTIEKSTQENMSLKRNVLTLTRRIDTLEQQMRSNNLEIFGVPQKQDENLKTILQKVAEHIDHPVFSNDVDTIFRADTNAVGKPKTIIVKFNQKKKRDGMQAAAKLKRSSTGLTTPGLMID
ncbi:hypothetical protein JTB14_025434 [Gonioctena quinquepunctata]|nr:hypothetical protein JTB14_025434 [Gonioctena quinquepunctata]